MPSMTDKRFARSVIYLCLHNAEGAMGLIINQRADNVSFAHLLRELGVLAKGAEEEVPASVLDRSIQIGGPVKTEHGFVLHSPDYSTSGSTLEIDSEIRLTNTVDILKAIARGRGPDRSLIALGYSGWAPGQLDSEIQANGWLSCPADPDLVFDPNLELKYDRALAKLGVDASHLVGYAGRA
jgi:putative transcriptional regulator